MRFSSTTKSKTWINWITNTIMVLLLVSCMQSSPGLLPIKTESQPTPTAQASTPTHGVYIPTVEVFPDQLRQTVQDMGSGAFIHRFGGIRTALDPISKLNITTFQPRNARVEIDLANWEPVNDNDSPEDPNPSGFRDTNFNHATFQFMQEMSKQGVEITASIWDVPDWMVEDPKMESARVIPRSMYPEVIESITTWLVKARDGYGVNIAYVSFNEADIGINILLSSTNVIELVKQAGPQFAKSALNTKWLLGDCSNSGGCLDYVKSIWSEESIRPYMGIMAFHTWDAYNVSDKTLSDLGDFALAQGLEIRCTEAGWDASLWQTPEKFPTWVNAQNIAVVFNRVLKLSRVTTFYYWQMMGNDYNLNDGNKPYPVMEIIKQYSRYIPVGSQIVATSPNRGHIYSVAAKSLQGFVVQLVNDVISSQVRLVGLPNGLYDVLLTNEDTVNQFIQTITVNDGTAELKLLGFSVYWIITHP